MEDLNIEYINVQQSDNQRTHRTDGFSDSEVLVVRRGAPFRISLQLWGRPLDAATDAVTISIMLGRLYVTLPVTAPETLAASPSSSPSSPPAPWRANFSPELDPRRPSVSICTPANAPVGTYRLRLRVSTQSGQKTVSFASFVLLCNPWCPEDAVHLPFEDQREEYVLSDSGLLYMGTTMNVMSRPWSFDQYEPGVLQACLNLLQVSPQHISDRRRDYLKRNSPVYISRVVSAMINSEDDRGVLKGNWTGEYKDGVHPSEWTGSGDVLTQWAKSRWHPVKYGQCWVFAAVMCTVMRVLGIPCRVVTNFNSAHDTNVNMVIEEFYSETGEKLGLSKDSIWNFHVWVECYMTRPSLGPEMDGWQVLDPTPQERSRGIYCCGPAPVKAIKERRIDLMYDVPFVYAEVNADVHTIIVKQGRVLGYSKDKDRVGSLICTKAIGLPRVQNITGDYKRTKYPKQPTASDATLSRGSSKGITVFLKLSAVPIVGHPVAIAVKVCNREPVAKVVKVHLNAQVKEYNHSPSKTFWELQGVMQLDPKEAKILQYQILPSQYEDVVGDDLVNLAVVLEDQQSQESILASEEFNLTNPELNIQVPDEDSVEAHKEHKATVTFTNPFSHPVSGMLTVSGAGLIQHKLHFGMLPLQPGATVEQRVTFVPPMAGVKMLQASLSLTNISSSIRGFKMVLVKHAAI